MLTLNQSRRADSATILRDFVLTDGQIVYTNIFYVIPDSPRFVATEDGGPAFDFLWYLSGAPQDQKAGGIVTMSLELAPTAEDAARLRQWIAQSYGVAADSVELRSAPFKSGSVELAFAAETTGGEFVNQVAGNGPAQLTGAERATFVVPLTADGAALLSKALDQHLRVFHLRYDLVFDYHLASVHMHVWCDVAKSLAAAQTWVAPGSDDPAQLRATLVAKSAAGIDIVSEEPLPAEQQAALQKSGEDVLDRALGSSLFAPATGNSAPKLLPYSSAMEGALNFTLNESFPLEKHAVLDSLLEIDLTPEQAARRIAKTNLTSGFFTVLDVQVACTVAFAAGLISLVHVRIEYDQTGDTGRVQRSGEFVFKAGSDPIQHFRTELAVPGKDSYNYTVDVYYRGDHAPAHFEASEVTNTVLILNLDGAGVLDVTLDLRQVPFESVHAAVVDVEYPSKKLAAQFILDGNGMSGRWQTIIGEQRQPWRYKASWVLTDGRRIEGEWIDTSASAVRLDAPAELRSKMRVLVVAAGDFTGLGQVLLDLRESDGSAQTQFAFFSAGQTHIWEPPAAPGSEIAYQYRRTLMFADGRNRVLDPDWVAETRPVLVVENPLSFHVQIVPRLLDLGASLRIVIVELESEATFVERRTLIVRTKTDQLQWTFGLDSADQHKYRYRLTPVTAQGDRQPPSDWRESDSEILVLDLPKV
jgi:hypothetical protein